MVAELNPSGFQQKRSNSNFKNVLLLLKDYSSRRLQKELPRKCWNKNGLDDLDDDEQLCNERQPGSRRMAGFRVWFAACRPSRHVRPHRPTPPMPASGDIKVSRIPYFRLMLVSCIMPSFQVPLFGRFRCRSVLPVWWCASLTEKLLVTVQSSLAQYSRCSHWFLQETHQKMR